jgi:hypothetical protein
LKRANLRRKSSTIPKAALALTEQQHSQSAVTLQGVAAFCFAQRYGVIASPHIILSLQCGEQKRHDAPRVKGRAHSSEKILKLFWTNLERTGRDTTLSKNRSTYEQQIPS